MRRFATGRGAVSRLAVGLTGMALAVGASACGASDPEDTDAGRTGTTATWPRTVTHDRGSTEIAARPQRIVALDNSLAEAVVLLGRPLVGGTGDRDRPTFPAYLGDAVRETRDVGPPDRPNLDLVASLRPDLIVSTTVRHDTLYDELSALAPTVLVAATGPTWKENVTLLGRALGAEIRAAQELTRYEARAKQLGDEINTRAANPTISVVRFGDGETHLVTGSSFVGVILADAGLRRPAAKDGDKPGTEDGDKPGTEIDQSRIDLVDADHVFVTTSSGGERDRRRFEADPRWQRLSAVRQNRMYEVRDEFWTTSASVQRAHFVLDDLADTFRIDPVK